MYFFGKTDIGKKREINQDAFASEKMCDNVFVFLVCDGMGGANGGNIASSVASKAFLDSMREGIQKKSDGGKKCELTPEDAEVMLIKSVRTANRAVYLESEKSDELSGMGTTLVGALIVDNTAFIVNVGDSRAYLIFGNVIDKVTHDHSYVQYLVDIGELTEEEAKNNVNKNIIMKAVGIDEKVDPDVFRVEFGDNAFLLLCSDGLTNYADESVIKDTVLSFDYESNLSKSDDMERVCNTLVDTANENGGGDNITVALYLHEHRD